MRSSPTSSKERTFRSGPYLDSLFKSAERMDAQLQAEICARIRQARKEAGFTLQEAADTIGITMRAYQNYEKSRVPFRTLTRIAGVFAVKEPWLLHGVVEAEDAETLAEIVRRLEALETTVDRLSTKEELQAGLDTLRAAIHAQASGGTQAGSETVIVP